MVRQKTNKQTKSKSGHVFVMNISVSIPHQVTDMIGEIQQWIQSPCIQFFTFGNSVFYNDLGKYSLSPQPTTT